jgi:precorrin-4/cobalt-precorrin-4 C11-methyltransferase
VSAAAAALGTELTVPGVSQTVVLTRLATRTTRSLGPGDDLAANAAQGGLLALFLSAGDPERLQSVLLGPGSAYSTATPAAIVHRASWPDEQVVATTVGALAGELAARGITTTALVLVGDALRPADAAGDGCVARSHVYDPAFATAYRDAE